MAVISAQTSRKYKNVHYSKLACLSVNFMFNYVELCLKFYFFFWYESDLMGDHASSDRKQTDVHSLSAPHVDEPGKVLLALVEVNLLVLREEDPSSQIKSLNGLLKGIHHITDMSKLSTEAKTFSAVALKLRKQALLLLKKRI